MVRYMTTVSSGADTLSALSAHADEMGAELAAMLQASSFPDEEKEAWVSVLPHMNVEEIGRFAELLKSHLAGRLAEEMEDTMLLLKAAEIRSTFAAAHAQGEER